MEKKVVIFKSFEEQEMYWLQHYYQMSRSERLRKLHELQVRNNPDFCRAGSKTITVHHQGKDGYKTS